MLEVTGFTFTDTLGIATTYYSNPFEPDSNRDGVSDFNEVHLAVFLFEQ